MTSDSSLSARILAFGYRVFMRDPDSTYAYFSDGERIGYVQRERGGGFTVSTVHTPSPSTGTGFNISRHAPLSAAILKEALYTHSPQWYRGNFDSVLKYRDLEHFLSASTWNAGFVEQA
jgi:hypothetical protein